MWCLSSPCLTSSGTCLQTTQRASPLHGARAPSTHTQCCRPPHAAPACVLWTRGCVAEGRHGVFGRASTAHVRARMLGLTHVQYRAESPLSLLRHCSTQTTCSMPHTLRSMATTDFFIAFPASSTHPLHTQTNTYIHNSLHSFPHWHPMWTLSLLHRAVHSSSSRFCVYACNFLSNINR
jgi:hypothetical protein